MLCCIQLLLAVGATIAAAKDWDSPDYSNWIFRFPLPTAPIKQPLHSYEFPGRAPIDYYEVVIKPLEQQIYPGLNKTKLVGYDGVVPGPTFKMHKGREAVVRFINNSTRDNSVHLHGSFSRAPFDGWADDTTQPGQFKDYYYPNAQNARTLWYHDHAIDQTAENAYFGQAGFYILHDEEELAISGLPLDAYDIPLALSAKRYNKDGTLWSPEANQETTSVYGDVIHVNGQPWPYLQVEPRKYRFRLLNTGVSRSYQLYFETPAGKRSTFNVVGSDAGLLTKPVASEQLDISIAERWEVVFDFAAFEGKNVTLKNNRKVGADEDFFATDRVMRFVVGTEVTDRSKNGDLPSTLRTVPFPPSVTGNADHTFEFASKGGLWKINGVTWADGPEQRILAKPKRGEIQIWDLQNGGGGWTHPIHIHLVDFQIVSRTGGERNQVLPYEKEALKDVVWLNKGERVRVIARYGVWDGLYMFHCHNLIHEDHAMMAAFNVTALADLGYNETTRFLDPMDPTYRPKSFRATDFQARTANFSDTAIEDKCKWFSKLNAYGGVEAIEGALEDYYNTKATTAIQSTTKISTGTSTLTPKTTSASGSTGTSTRTI